MKKVVLAFILSGFSIAASAAGYIDAATAKADKSRKAFIKSELVKQCGKKASYSCEGKVLDAANDKFPLRGSKAYSEANYKKLSKPMAALKLRELGVAYNKASAFSNNKDGEVKKSDLEAEGWWIVKNVLKIDRYRYQLVKPWVNEKGIPLKGLNPSA